MVMIPIVGKESGRITELFGEYILKTNKIRVSQIQVSNGRISKAKQAHNT